MSDLLTQLMGFVDTQQLEYTQETHEGINKSRLIQGDSKFANLPDYKDTVFAKGGIGLLIDTLDESIISKGQIIKVEGFGTESQYVTFPSLEMVVLASSHYRRFYADVNGERQLACGTNRDGVGATGWTGEVCKTCPYLQKNWVANGNLKDDACKGNIAALVYFPELDHFSLFTGSPASYMEISDWLNQVSKLSKAFAQRPELKAINPNLSRVNTFFFKTRIQPGPIEQGEKGTFQRLQYQQFSPPYAWDQTMLCSTETLGKIKEAWPELETVWKSQYVDPNMNATLVIAAKKNGTLPGQMNALAVNSSAVLKEVVPPTAAAEVMQQPAPPAQQTVAPAQQTAPVAPPIQTTTIALDDVDPPTPADAPAPYVAAGF